MDSHFKDAIKIRKEKPEPKPKDGKNSPWNFTAPEYDERSSCFVNAGNHYGVGHRNPVGSEKHNPKSAVPYGRKPTMEVDEVG